MVYFVGSASVDLGYSDDLYGISGLSGKDAGGSGIFSGVGIGAVASAISGEALIYSVSNVAFTADIQLEVSDSGGNNWRPTGVFYSSNPSAPEAGYLDVDGPPGTTKLYRWNCVAHTSGTAYTAIFFGVNLIKGFVDLRGNTILNIHSDGIDVAGKASVFGLSVGTNGVTSPSGIQGGSLFIYNPDDNTSTSVTIANNGQAGSAASILISPPVSLVDSITLTYPSNSGTMTTDEYVNPGAEAVNVLAVAADVSETETVTIGDDVYEVEIVNTDSTDNTANNNFANTNANIVLSTFTADYPNTTIAVGGLLRVESEIMRCTASSGASRTFNRGVSGTTVASHANANDMFVGDGIDGASTIAVGLVTTLTPTAFTPALVADVNRIGSEAVTAVQISVNEILIHADAVGVVELACAETLAGVGNAWGSATMYGGVDPGARTVVVSRVPTALEVTTGNLHFHFDFAPTVVSVSVFPTATPGVAKAWDGGATVATNLVTLDNDGATDWAETDTVVLTVQG